MNPAQPTPQAAPQVSSRSWLLTLAYILALGLALLGMTASLAIPQTIDADIRTARYGEPVWFAESDMSQRMDLSSRREDVRDGLSAHWRTRRPLTVFDYWSPMLSSLFRFVDSSGCGRFEDASDHSPTR
jgi:hypothetical protein